MCEAALLNQITTEERGAFERLPLHKQRYRGQTLFNGECLVLALCWRAADFVCSRRSSSTVVCNIGWEQIIWKASNALCLCKLYEILTKLIYSFFSENILYCHWFPVNQQSFPRLIPRNAATFLNLASEAQGVIILFLLIRSAPVAQLVKVKQRPQSYRILSTRLYSYQ